MSRKSKASDRTKLGTGAAPINCQNNPVKLKSVTILLFLELPFYENYQTLDSRDTRPFTRQDGYQNRHKVYGVAYGSRKIKFLIFQNNQVFFASAFLPVQFNSNTEYSVNSVFQSIPYIPYLSNRPHFLWVYRRDNPRGMLGEHEKSL